MVEKGKSSHFLRAEVIKTWEYFQTDVLATAKSLWDRSKILRSSFWFAKPEVHTSSASELSMGKVGTAHLALTHFQISKSNLTRFNSQRSSSHYHSKY